MIKHVGLLSVIVLLESAIPLTVVAEDDPAVDSEYVILQSGVAKSEGFSFGMLFQDVANRDKQYGREMYLQIFRTETGFSTARSDFIISYMSKSQSEIEVEKIKTIGRLLCSVGKVKTDINLGRSLNGLTGIRAAIALKKAMVMKAEMDKKEFAVLERMATEIGVGTLSITSDWETKYKNEPDRITQLIEQYCSVHGHGEL